MDVARAVLGRLEDDRVDEPHERRVGDAVVGLEVVRLDVCARLAATASSISAAFSASDARASRRSSVSTSSRTAHRELGRVARREPELVEPVDVLRLGDRDPQPLAVERERDRADALEHGQRDQPRRLEVDALDGEVDERQVELLRELPASAIVERARESRRRSTSARAAGRSGDQSATSSLAARLGAGP